jgi:hypothetical protein
MGIALLVSTNSYAGIISSLDTHTTSDGSVVDLSGLDWLTWDVTLGQNRASVESGFSGLVNSGWRYATIAEYSTLMASVFDTHSGWSADNQDGAQWIYDTIYGLNEAPHTSVYNYQSYYNLYGSDTECGSSAYSCRGHYRLRSPDWASATLDQGWSTAGHNNGTYSMSIMQVPPKLVPR